MASFLENGIPIVFESSILDFEDSLKKKTLEDSRFDNSWKISSAQCINTNATNKEGLRLYVFILIISPV